MINISPSSHNFNFLQIVQLNQQILFSTQIGYDTHERVARLRPANRVIDGFAYLSTSNQPTNSTAFQFFHEPLFMNDEQLAQAPAPRAVELLTRVEGKG